MFQENQKRRSNMKLKDLLLELADPKPIPKATGKERNDSYKCENIKDFKDAITKMTQVKKGLLLAIILDVAGSIAYMTDRSSFHEDMAHAWGIPYSSSNKNFLLITATYSTDKGIRPNKLQMSSIHQKSIDDLNSGWLKRVFST
jgi:hypothetical protein